MSMHEIQTHVNIPKYIEIYRRKKNGDDNIKSNDIDTE